MLLPPDPLLTTLVRQTAALYHRLGREIGERPLVLPSSRFFPDRFTKDQAGAERLLYRMQQHSGMVDVPLQLRLIEGAGAVPSGCGSCGCGPTSPRSEKIPSSHEKAGCGKDHECACRSRDGSSEHECACRSHDGSSNHDCGCPSGTDSDDLNRRAEPSEVGSSPEARLVDLGNAWRVQLPKGELQHPVVLTTNLARTLGYVFLLETLAPGESLEGSLEVTAEIASCLLGFGALLLAGSHIYTKSCGGPSIRRVTTLGCGDLAMVTALFVAKNQHNPGPLQRELEATQAEAFKEAQRWLRSRTRVVDALCREPARLARSDFDLGESSGSFWSRWFGRPSSAKPRDESSASLDELETMLTETPLATGSHKNRKPPPDDDLAALVEQELGAQKPRADHYD